MGLSWNPIKNIGSVVSGIGTAMNLPEMGISEKLTGNKVTNSGGFPSWSQPFYNNPSVTYSQGGAPSQSQAQQQGNNDQTQVSGGYGTSSGGRSSGGSGGGSTFDPNSVIEAQDIINQANNLLSRLPGQRDVFNQNINDTFGKYRSQLQNDYGRNKENWSSNRANTIKDQENAKARIDSQVRSRANALQRLLGAAGAGDSEAALSLAPYAAARTGTNLRNQINQTYGKNLQGLDQSWKQYEADYGNEFNSLADQEKQKRDEFEQSLLQKQMSALDDLRKGQSALTYAQTGNAAQAKAIRDAALPQLYQLLQQIDQLGRQQITPYKQDVSYAAPELSQYTTENVGNVGGVDPAVQEDVNPYYQYLLKKSQEDNQFFGY